MRDPKNLILQRFGALLEAFKLSRIKGGSRRVAQDHSRVLDQVSVRLNSAMSEMEASFVRVGDSLEALDACSRRLIGKCEALIHMASGSEEGEKLLREALEILKGPLAYIDYCMSRNQKLLELLAQCEEQTRGMLSIRSRMHDAIAPLTFMAVMFKIESAYLPDEHRETFLTVTAEVERLHHLVDETFAQNAHQLDDAHETLSKVRQHLEADFRKQAVYVASKRAGIDTAILTLDQQLSKNTERDVRLHDHGAMLTGEVSRIVMGIQFQDIVKQKCDHVIEALAREPSSVSDWGHTLALQVRQLAAVRSDLDGGSRSMQDGLGRIEEYTEQLNRSSVSLENIESMTAAMDGMVQLLLDTLQDVTDIIHMVTKLTEEGYSAVKPASGLARNLTETIVELAINMQLIALNAQVRSVQSGQGTGLELLAARTAEVSSEIDEISEKISTDLAQLHLAIDEMLNLFNEFLERGNIQLSELAQNRGPAELRLHALRDRTIQAVQDIGDEIDSMFSAAKTVHASLDSIPKLSHALSEVGEFLEANEPENLHPHSASHALSGLLHRYTMASERAVHESFIAEVAKKAPMESKPTKTTELAELQEPGVAPATQQPPFRSPTVPSSPQPASSSMGDNVELF